MLNIQIINGKELNTVTVEKEYTPKEYNDLLIQFKDGSETITTYNSFNYFKAQKDVDTIFDLRDNKTLYINFI